MAEIDETVFAPICRQVSCCGHSLAAFVKHKFRPDCEVLAKIACRHLPPKHRPPSGRRHHRPPFDAGSPLQRRTRPHSPHARATARLPSPLATSIRPTMSGPGVRAGAASSSGCSRASSGTSADGRAAIQHGALTACCISHLYVHAAIPDACTKGEANGRLERLPRAPRPVVRGHPKLVTATSSTASMRTSRWPAP